MNVLNQSTQEFLNLYREEVQEFLNSTVGSYSHDQTGDVLDEMFSVWDEAGEDVGVLNRIWDEMDN